MSSNHSLTEDLTAVLEHDRGLPGRFFTDEAAFQAERSAIFERSWVCIGLADDAPVKGDFAPVELLGMPLLLVRDAQQLRVFHNVCSHRGAKLIEQRRHGVRIVCPYHSWAYTLSGALVSTPHVGGAGQHSCPGMNTGTLGLREIRSAEWAGFVFVDLSGTAPDFADWIRPVQERFAHVNWSQLRHERREARTLDVAANWKIIAENFVESYHVPWVHPSLNAVNSMSTHYQILGGHSYLGQGGTDYKGDPAAQRPILSGWTDRSRYEVLFIFPNLILSPLPDMVFAIIIDPVSAGRSRERVAFFFAGDEAMHDRYADARRIGAKFVVDVNAEDVRIVESVQRGRHSPAFVGGQFARPQEETSLQFQKIVAAHLLGAQQGKPAEELIALPVRDILHPVAA